MAYQLRYWPDVKKPDEYEVIETSNNKNEIWWRFYDLCDELEVGQRIKIVEIDA